MRVVLTGGSGLIGSALRMHLTNQGWEVVQLVRRAPTDAAQVQWNPDAGELNPAVLSGADAVVNLAGAGVGDRRWTAAYRDVIRRSRVRSTATIVQAILAADAPPQVLVNASAQGIYGDRGETVLTEQSERGTGFLADVVADWEAQTEPAAQAGIRVALARTGLVLTSRGGAFAPLIRLARLGLAGPIGGGQAWWSWITLDDEIRALQTLMTEPIAGPVNLCSPHPARNREIITAIATQLHRPAYLPVSRLALRAVVGEFANDILASTRMAPTVLANATFTWTHPDLSSAVHDLVPSPT